MRSPPNPLGSNTFNIGSIGVGAASTSFDVSPTQRLGRLIEAEHWVGFAEFANSAGTAARAQQGQDLERGARAMPAGRGNVYTGTAKLTANAQVDASIRGYCSNCGG